MKFKNFLSEGFFGDLLDKGFERLQGYDRGARIKKTKENFRRLGSDITELFEKNGFKLVLTEPEELYFGFSNHLLYANKSNNRLIAVADSGRKFTFRCYDKNTLRKESFKTDCDDTNIWEVVDAVCKGKYDELKHEKPEPKKFRSPPSDDIFLWTAKTMNWCDTDPEVQRLIGKHDLLSQIKIITGKTIPRYVSEESVEKAIKYGLSLGQLYFFVVMRALGYLSEKDCLSIASKYNV